MSAEVDEALEAAALAFKHTAQSEIDAVKSEMRDVLRVQSGTAPKEAIPPDLPAPRL